MRRSPNGRQEQPTPAKAAIATAHPAPGNTGREERTRVAHVGVGGAERGGGREGRIVGEKGGTRERSLRGEMRQRRSVPVVPRLQVRAVRGRRRGG